MSTKRATVYFSAEIYRIVYTIRDDRLIVMVIRVAHRREAYRG